MNNIIEALQNGKVAKFNSPEPRYYRLIAKQLQYSEDNRSYKVSTATMDIFADVKQWIVID